MIQEINQKTKEKYQSFGMKGLNKRFRLACLSGRLDIIHYMLTSNDLKQNVDIHTGDDFAFRMACKKGYVDVAKYLLESVELKEHASINIYKDIVFRQSVENRHSEIFKYLSTYTLKLQLEKELKTNEPKKIIMKI
jgi:ankyrin repeat protein